jgi:hypothetical protein
MFKTVVVFWLNKANEGPKKSAGSTPARIASAFVVGQR